jgi:hypothetical protein
MSTQTLIHDRRQRLKAQQERRAADELNSHLRAAAKMCGAAKGRAITVTNLSPAAEIALLEEYATRLELEARDFLEAWPGDDGRRAVRWFRMERAKVLQTLAKLKISSAKDEFEK